MSVAEIADRVGLHHNAVRQHLRTLAAAGVIASAPTAPKGRGRPSARYWLIDEEAPSLAGHQELLRLLVGLVSRADIGAEEVEAFGREAGETLASTDDREGVLAVMARLGFSPRERGPSEDADAGVLDLSLESCPFREAVLAPGGEAICTLHLGLLSGMARRVRGAARVTRFEPKDPNLAGCRARIEGLAASADT
jgi:predicted ArsR family transcriptional regulator